jgi:hypothetical protein
MALFITITHINMLIFISKYLIREKLDKHFKVHLDRELTGKGWHNLDTVLAEFKPEGNSAPWHAVDFIRHSPSASQC